MRRLILLPLIALLASAHAEVFRHVGPDGEIYFSDRPAADAMPVEMGRFRQYGCLQ
jgi:hypothetical protein